MLQMFYPNQSSYVLVQRYKNSYPVIGELTEITCDNEYMVRFDIKQKAVKISHKQILVQKTSDSAYDEVHEILKAWVLVKHSVEECMKSHKWEE